MGGNMTSAICMYSVYRWLGYFLLISGKTPSHHGCQNVEQTQPNGQRNAAVVFFTCRGTEQYKLSYSYTMQRHWRTQGEEGGGQRTIAPKNGNILADFLTKNTVLYHFSRVDPTPNGAPASAPVHRLHSATEYETWLVVKTCWLFTLQNYEIAFETFIIVVETSRTLGVKTVRWSSKYGVIKGRFFTRRWPHFKQKL